MQNYNRDDGFTLIEVLVTIAMIGILVIPVMNYFNAGYVTFLSEIEKVDVQMMSRNGTQILLTNLREADQETITVSGNNKLSFVVNKAGKKLYTYYLSNSLLLQEEKIMDTGKKASNQLLYNVQNFNVEKMDDGVLRITIVLKGGQNRSNIKNVNINATYRIKNKGVD